MSIIIEIWKNQPGKFFCISTKDGAGEWKDHFFSPEEFGSIKAFIRENSDKDIYFCPHGFNRRVRRKGEAVLPNMLWADLDFSDPRDKQVFYGLKPTIAIESSPGRFVGLWLLKEPMTEDINRRLTYHVDADHGGWDLTQVLRMPGTRNYKYASQPRVRVLWDDGPVYSLKRILKYLPEQDEAVTAATLSAAAVFEEYENKLPRWVRRELLTKRLKTRTDRSEMLWKLENACIEAGMSMDEAFAVLKASAWNKFAGRRNEDEQLRRELSKIVEHQFAEKPKAAEKRHRKSDKEISDEEREPGLLVFRPMSEIKREKLDFLWWPYLVKGEVTILEGDPGLGKSYLAQMVAGAIASGQRIPCYKKGQPVIQGPVVYFDIENSAATVSKPRLEDNGYTDLNNFYPVEQAFSIDDDEVLDEVYNALEEIRPALVVFDTLNTYIGRADAHKASEVTQAMNVFKGIARDFNCSVLVLRHLTKGSGSAMYRGQGSIAFSGSARVVMSVGVDPKDTETRVMAVTKINFAKAPQALEFRIEERKHGKSEFIWGDFVNLSSQEIMDAASAARAEGKQGDHIQGAMEFLEETLNGKTMDVEKLYRMAEKRSIPQKMIDRAFHKMDIRVISKGGETLWRMKTLKEREEDEDEE